MNIVQAIEGEPRVSSEIIAEETQNQHKNVLGIIRANIEDFERFGQVAFETRAGYNNAQVSAALLNEPQATLLITFMRNSEKVRCFKLALVSEFYAMRQELAQPQPAAIDLTSLDGIAALAAAAQQAVAEARIAEAKVAELEPKAEHTDMLRSSDGKLTIPDVFVQIKTHAATNYPDVRIYQADVFDLAGDLGICIRGNTIRNNQTTARALEAGWAVPADHQYPDSKGRWHTSYVTHLTHRGAGRLWDAAIKNIKTYGAVRAPKKDVAA